MRLQSNNPARWIRVWLAVGLLGLAIAACGGSGGSDQEKNPEGISVFLIPSPSADAIKKSIPAFTKKTGIEVNTVESPYDDAHQKQLLAFRSKRGKYDVVQFDNPFLAAYGSQGVLKPLDGYLKESKTYDIDDFVPALQDYGKYQDETLGLDLSTEPFILWYRTDIYKSLGLQPPRTWTEYAAAAKKIQASGQASGQIMAYAAPQTTWWWLQLVWSFGGDLHDSDLKPTVTTPEAKQATQYMKDLLKASPKAALSANVDETTSVFISAPVGQMINYSGFYPVVTDPKQSKIVGKVGYAPSPTEKTDITELTGWNIGIPSDSRKQDAAWKFLEFVLGKPRAKQFLLDGAAAVGRTSITRDPELTQKYPYLKALVPAAEAGRRLPALPQWPEVQNAIGTRVADIMTGKSSVDDGLSQLQDDLEGILGNGG